MVTFGESVKSDHFVSKKVLALILSVLLALSFGEGLLSALKSPSAAFAAPSPVESEEISQQIANAQGISAEAMVEVEGTVDFSRLSAEASSESFGHMYENPEAALEALIRESGLSSGALAGQDAVGEAGFSGASASEGAESRTAAEDVLTGESLTGEVLASEAEHSEALAHEAHETHEAHEVEHSEALAHEAEHSEALAHEAHETHEAHDHAEEAVSAEFISSFESAIVQPFAELQPGTPEYYAARWQDCVNGFSWKTTGLPKWDGNVAGTAPTSGSGTAADPYLIYTAEQLRWAMMNQRSCILMNDLDLGGDIGRNWNGIVITVPMVIDGNGYTIYNLYSHAYYAPGFIAAASGGNNYDFVLKNLTISNAEIESDRQLGAPLVGFFDGGWIDNCAVFDSLAWAHAETSTSNPAIGGAITSAFPNSEGIPGTPRFLPAKVTNTYTYNVDVFGIGCSSGFAEVASNILIENCASIEGDVVVPLGHSGGFTSCTYGPLTYRNCFTNNNVYGNTQTGVFAGAIHSGDHYYENCWAAGKIEGTNLIGGFFGQDTDLVGTRVFTNCYSTSMVGMSSGGTNMGGFAGEVNSLMTFNNCYVAGEVGTLYSNNNGEALQADGATVVASVGGFAGRSASSAVFNNCYYDKQTTGSKENTIGTTKNVPGITGLLTKSLAETDISAAFDASINGTYPQLTHFYAGNAADWGGNQTLASLAKAYSEASTSTVFLYPSFLEGAEYDALKNDTDVNAYDTVRRIRYGFPLTNDATVQDPNIDTVWQYFDDGGRFPNDSPVNPGTPIILLSATDPADPDMDEVAVESVASGVGWLRVETTYNNTTTGSRNLRLVPTTSVAVSQDLKAIVGSDITAYSLPNNSSGNYVGFDATEDATTLFDHSEGIQLIEATALQLQRYLDAIAAGQTTEQAISNSGITLRDFADPVVTEYLGLTADGTTLEYRVRSSNQIVHVTIEKEVPTAEGEEAQRIPLLWDEHLLSVFRKQSQAAYGDIGYYIIKYAWMDETGTATQASGSKYVTIIPPLSLTYYLGYTPASGGSNVHFVDAGAYYNTQTINDRASFGKALPANPERHGYDFMGWKLFADQTKSFDATTPIVASTDESGYTDTVINLVAAWESHKHTITVVDEAGTLPSVNISNVPFSENVRSTVSNNNAALQDYLTEYFLGWKIVSGLPGYEGQMLTSIQSMPDNNITLAPLYGSSDIQGKKLARNLTQGALAADVYNQVGDVIEFEISFTNPTETKWTVNDIFDQLDSTLSFVPGSISLTKPDGTIASVPDTAFDSSNNMLQVSDPEGIELLGGESVLLVFQARLTNEAPTAVDISNQAYTQGLDANGQADGPYPSDSIGLPGNGEVLFVEAEKWISKTVQNTTNPNSSRVQVGDVLEYTIEIGNSSSNPYSMWQNAWVYDKIPEGLQLIPWTIEMSYPDPASTTGAYTTQQFPSGYNAATQELILSAGSLGSGQKATVSMSAYVTDAALGQSLKNTAWALTTNEDPPNVPGPGGTNKPTPDPNNPDPGPTDPVGPGESGSPELRIEKSSTVTQVSPGSVFPYTITISNVGSDHARNITIKDVLPDGLEYVSATPAATVNGQDVSWLATVPAGMSISRSLVVRVVAVPGTEISNSVRCIIDPNDPSTDLVDESPFISVVAEEEEEGGLSIVKSVNADVVLPGSQLSYSLTVINSSSSDAQGVVITDPLPSGTLYGGASDGGSHSNGVVNWTIDVPAQGVKELKVYANVEARSGVLINVASSIFEGVTEISNPVETRVESKTQLSMTKTTPFTQAPQGTDVPYTITIQNTGNSDAYNVRVSDPLPEGLSYVSSSSNGAYSTADNTVTWLVNVPAGRTVTLGVVAKLTGEIGTSITNSAEAVDPADRSVTLRAETDPVVFITDPNTTSTAPNLSLAKTVSATSATQGDTLTYRLIAYNTGGKEAANVWVSDRLPQGLSFVAAESDAGLVFDAASRMLSWNGTVAANANKEIVVNVHVDASTGTLYNEANLTYEDQSRASNRVATTLVPDPDATGTPDLYVSKTANLEQAAPGAVVNYTIEATNRGTAASNNVVIQDELPAGLTYESSSPEATSVAGNVLTWQVNSIAAGETVTRELKVKVAEDASGALLNVVRASDDSGSSDEYSDSPGLEVFRPAENAPLLSISKTVDKSTAAPGDILRYSLTASNTGNAEATAVVLSDTLPEGLVFVSGDPAGFSLEGNKVSWTCDLAAGESKSFSFEASISAASGRLTNTAEAHYDDKQATSNAVTTLVTGGTPPGSLAPDLKIKKSTPLASVRDGAEIPYLLSIENKGSADATGVTLSDSLGAGLSYVSSTHGGTEASGTITWTNLSIPAGAWLDIMVIAKVNAQGRTSFINTAQASDPTLDAASPTIIGPVQVETPLTTGAPDTEPSLFVLKTVDQSQTSQGQTLNYTLAVSNVTSLASGRVMLSDRLPEGLDFVSSATPGVTVSHENGLITWTIDDIAAYSTLYLQFAAQVTAQSGLLVNSATAHLENYNKDAQSNEAMVLVAEPEAQPQISITKTTSVTQAAVGTQVPYTLTVSNTGLADATGVEVSDLLPAGLNFVSSNPAPTSQSGSTLNWVLNVPAGGQVSITLLTQIAAGATGSINNTAEAHDPTTGTTVQPPATPSITVLTAANTPLVSVTKAVDKTTAKSGDSLSYTLSATNTGTAAATGVVLSDSLPNGLTVSSSDPAGATLSGNTISWPAITLAVGETKSFSIQAQVNAKSGTLLNTAKLSYDSNKQVTSNSVATVVEPDPPSENSAPNLSISKTTSVTSLVEGSSIGYTIIVENQGDAEATDVAVTDTLEQNLSYVSSSPEGSVAGNTVSWTGLSVPVGGRVELKIVAEAALGSSGQTAINSVVGSYSTGSTRAVVPFGPVQVTTPITALGSNPTPVLSLEKSASNYQATYGDVIDFSLALINTGEKSSGQVTVTDTLPAGLEFVAAPGNVYVTESGGVVTWIVDDVAAQSTLNLNLQARVTARNGIVSNSAEAVPKDYDQKITSNVAPIAVEEPVPEAILSVTKTTSVATTVPGAQLPYTITVKNTGTATATGVMVNDTLPAALSYVSSSPVATQDPSNDKHLSWVVDVPAGGQVNISLLTELAEEALGGVSNTVSVVDPNKPGTEIKPPVDPGTEIIDPEANALIGVSKLASSDSVLSGSQLTYTISLSNAGTADATDVQASDKLPAGASFVSASDGGVLVGNEVQWSLDLAAFEEKQLSVVVNVDAAGGNELLNTASTTHHGKKASASIVTPVQSTSIESNANLRISAIFSASEAPQGAVIPYTITVTNLGEDLASAVNIKDSLPAGLEYLSATPVPTVSGQELGWNADIPAGQSVTRVVMVRVVGNPGDTLVNTASASSDSTGTIEAQASLRVVEEIEGSRINLVKYGKRDTAPTGGRFAYGLLVSNIGNTEATRVLVSDTLPRGTSFVEASDGAVFTPSSSGTGGTVTWEIDLAAGECKELNLVVMTEISAGTLTNIAVASHEGISTQPSIVVTPITSETQQADPVPALTKTGTNTTAVQQGRADSSLGASDDKDIIEFQLLASNAKDLRSVPNPEYDPINNPGAPQTITIEVETLWHEVVLSDVLPKGLNIVGTTVDYYAPGQTSATTLNVSEIYDATTRTIRVEVGDVVSGQEARLIYNAQIKANEIEQDATHIVNSAEARGLDPSGSIIIAKTDSETLNVPDPWPIKKLSKTATNLTDPADSKVQVGDRILYAITLSNTEPDARSLWVNAYIYDLIPVGLDIDMSTLLLVDGGGSEYDIAECYSASTRELIVSAGSLYGGQSAVVSFEAIIPLSAVGQDISNVASVGKLNPSDPDVPELPGKPGEGTLPEPAEPVLDTDPNNPDPPPTDPVVSNVENSGGSGEEDGIVVVADPAAALSKTVKGLANTDTYYQGDLILYTVVVSNGRAETMWTDVVFEDKIPFGVSLDTSSIRLVNPQGISTDLPASSYDLATRTLKVDLGTIEGGQNYTLSYVGRLDLAASAGDIVNQAYASGIGVGSTTVRADASAAIHKDILPWNPGTSGSGLMNVGDFSNGIVVSLASMAALALLLLAFAVRRRLKGPKE